MRTIALTFTAAVLGLAVAAAQAPAPAKPSTAKPATARPAAKPAGVPRMPDGRPDLQGNWTNATITPLRRPLHS